MVNEFYIFIITKPKHIFLVHGEPESQDVLKEKIESEIGIPVTTPEFGETYKLEEQIEMVNKLERKVTKTLRNEILERLDKLKEEIKDMDIYVRQ